MSVDGTAPHIRRRRDLFEANHAVGASLNGRYAHLNVSLHEYSVCNSIYNIFYFLVACR